MVATSRSAAFELEASLGQSIWSILCRALRSVGWAAAACGLTDTANQVERSELLVGNGVTPDLPHPLWQESVDWARLDAAGRGQLASEMRRVVRMRHTH